MLKEFQICVDHPVQKLDVILILWYSIDALNTGQVDKLVHIHKPSSRFHYQKIQI